MAIQNEPTRIQIPFADSGTKNVIPDTNSTPSASQAASWTDGFPSQCSLPLSAGGIPPARADFNGIFNTMTQSERFTQEGGVWTWDATVDYGTSRVVLGSDGLLYWSIAQSGPNVGGAQDPTADSTHTYWDIFQVPTGDVTNNTKDVANTEWVALYVQYLQVSPQYYVNPSTGSDSNDGLSASTPKKTIANTINTIKSKKIQTLNTTIVISLAAGSYSESFTLDIMGFAIRLQGPSSGFAELSGGIGAPLGNTILQIGGRISLTSAIGIGRGANITFLDGCYIKFNNLGNTATSLNIYSNSTVSAFANNNVTIEYSGTNTFSTGTVNVVDGGLLATAGSISVVNSGTVSGPRYKCTRNGGISGAGSTTLFPGSSNGSVDSTSFYA